MRNWIGELVDWIGNWGELDGELEQNDVTRGLTHNVQALIFDWRVVTFLTPPPPTHPPPLRPPESFSVVNVMVGNPGAQLFNSSSRRSP